MKTLSYTVAGMHCGHCEAAIKSEVSTVPGVEEVVVDLESKRLEVSGETLDDVAIRAAVAEAGYEAT